MAERTPERLVRLLGLVAYLDRNPGVPVEQVAAHFAVSPAQVLRDVDTLWMTGTPGYWPDDLIDFDAASLDSGRLRLTQSRGMTRALRLGTREAVALVAALRALVETAGPALADDERDLLVSTLQVLATATGEAAATVEVELAVQAPVTVLAEVRAALRDGTRLLLRYVDAADTTSEREVDPWALLTGDEHSYLQAWCHAAGGERLFRLDRVLEARAIEVPATTRPTGEPELGFHPGREHEAVVLDLDGRARWVAEQLPVEEVVDLADGAFRVVLRVANPSWLHSLLLRLAPDVRGISPAALGRDVAAAAGRALAAYDPPGH